MTDRGTTGRCSLFDEQTKHNHMQQEQSEDALDFTFAHFSFSRNFDFVKFISPICFVSQLVAFLYGLIYPLTRFMPKIMKFCRKLRGTGVMAFFFSYFFFRKKNS